MKHSHSCLMNGSDQPEIIIMVTFQILDDLSRQRTELESELDRLMREVSEQRALLLPQHQNLSVTIHRPPSSSSLFSTSSSVEGHCVFRSVLESCARRSRTWTSSRTWWRRRWMTWLQAPKSSTRNASPRKNLSVRRSQSRVHFMICSIWICWLFWLLLVVLAEKLNGKVAELSQQLLEKQEIDAHMRSAFDQINSEHA